MTQPPSPKAPTEPHQREKPHPQSPFQPSLKVPGRRALLQVPQRKGPLWKEMPVSRAFSAYPSGSPARKPSLQVPFTELPQRETPHNVRCYYNISPGALTPGSVSRGYVPSVITKMVVPSLCWWRCLKPVPEENSQVLKRVW